jgi:hypothetical protein
LLALEPDPAAELPPQRFTGQQLIAAARYLRSRGMPTPRLDDT